MREEEWKRNVGELGEWGRGVVKEKGGTEDGVRREK